MKKILLFLFLCIQTLSAQITFYKQYGQGQMQSGIGSSCVQQTLDSGFVMAGFIYPDNSDAQVYLVKTKPNGDTAWTKIIGGPTGFYMGTFVQQTKDTGYIVTGTYRASEVYIIKTNKMGDTLWTKHYDNGGASVITSVQQTTDNGYIIATTSPKNSGDIYLLKTDVNGDTLWTRTYGGSNSESGYSVQQTTDGGYIIGGETWSNTAGSSDAYLIKTDAGGDTLWTKKYGGANGEAAHEVRQTNEGGYVFCGGNGDIYVVKINASGALTWQKSFGGISHDEGFSIKQTSDGGYVIAGQIDHFSSALSNYVADACLLKINSLGTQQWNRNFGPLLGNPSASYGTFVALTSDGGYVLTGENAFDFLIKTDSMGTILTAGIFSENLNENSSSVLVYPNPSSGRFSIEMRNPEDLSLEVYNCIGEKIYSSSVLQSKCAAIDLSDKPNGIYFLKLNGNEEKKVVRLIKI